MLAWLGLAILSMGATAHASAKGYSLNITRQSLDTALQDLARQTGLQIGRFSDAPKVDTSVGPVIGKYTAEEALKLLLGTSGLVYQPLNDRAFIVLTAQELSRQSAEFDAGSTTNSNCEWRCSQSGSESIETCQKKYEETEMLNTNCATRWSYLLAGMLGTGMTLTTSTGHAQETTDSENVLALEEIVITAERRTNNLQKVASSISVRDGNKLREEGKFSIEQILQGVPGVGLTSTRGSGGAGTDTPNVGIVIRGIATNVATGGSTISQVPATATYVDGIYGGVGSDYDLERVEILRGPQGTLYGRSATAGVVAFHSRAPILGEFGGDISVEAGNYSLARASGAVNFPIGETLALRVSGLHYDRDGYYARRGDAKTENAGRAKLLFKPSENFSALVGVALQNDTSHTGELSPYIPSASRSDTILYQQVKGASQSTPVIGTNNGKFRQYWAEVNWNLGFATLTYLPAVRTWKQDSLAYNMTTMPPDAPGIFEQPIITPDDTFHTQELRLASDTDGFFTWQAGALYYNNDIRTRNINYDYPRTGSVLDFNNDRTTHKDTTDSGVFGEGTFHFTDSLRFTGGLRYDWTTLKVDETYIRQPSPPPFPPNAAIPARQTYSINAEEKYTNFTYKGRLEYDLTPSSLAYASISTGFLPGDMFVVQTSINGVQGLKRQDLTTETLTSFEIGTKNRFLGDTLQLNASAFYYDYGAYQLGGVNIGTVPNPQLVTLSSPAKVLGGELETTWQATRTDRVGLNLAYADAKFVDSSAEFKTYSYLDQMPNVSKWTAEGSYGHTFEFDNGRSLTINLEGRYRSSQILNVMSKAQLDAGKLPFIQVGGQFTADANVLLKATDTISLSVYSRNIFDNRYKAAANYISAAPPPGTAGEVSIGRESEPRTFGVVLNYGF